MSAPNALVVQERQDRLSVSQVANDQAQIWKLMSEVMQKGEDYGTTPGSKKPSLYKSGSEKILTLFRLSVDVLVEELNLPNGGPFDEYRVRCYVTVKEMSSGRFIGKGLGECSSFEEKYKWREASGDGEFGYHQAMNPELVRVKFKKEWKNNFPTGKELQEKQVRVQTADRMNTVLKMAKKRAQIDATLTATAASSIFTQDVEDMPENLRNAVDEEDRSQETERQRPQRKSEKEAKPSAKTDTKAGDEEPTDPLCITVKQTKMLYAISRECKLSEDEVKAKLKTEFKDKSGAPLEHSKDMLKADFQRYIDSIDPEFKHHTRGRS